LHFGRINDEGDWAAFGLAPAAMFVTGAIMWSNRVLRAPWQARHRALARAL
jgi:uncharacterized iron-regulated membrane protein